MFYGHALRPAWSPLPIILVLLAFWVAWPLGLALLVAFLFWGHHIRHLRSHFDGMCRNGAWADWGRSARNGDWGGRGFGGRSGNSAFDDYRDAELRRLDEERRKLDEERREFEQYVHDLRRARDKDEFDRFMADRARRAKPKGDTIDL